MLKRLFSRIRPSYALLIAVGLALTLVLTMSSATAQDEKVIVIGHTEVAEAYDPAHGFSPTAGIVDKATYDTLVTFPDGDASSIEPLLASDWSISDDGLTYTFTLRDDVTFANGDPLQAEDVVFSFNRLKTSKLSLRF